MVNNIDVVLSKKSLKSLKRTIRSLKKDIKSSKMTINNNIGNQYAKDVKLLHDYIVSGFPVDTFDHSASVDMKTLRTRTIVSISGPNVVYDEFGVGDIGASYEHPYHSELGMNPYSSGPYISTHEDSEGHYWDTPYGQRYGWTSGRFVFDSVQIMKNGKAKDIARVTINDIVKKVTE